MQYLLAGVNALVGLGLILLLVRISRAYSWSQEKFIILLVRASRAYSWSQEKVPADPLPPPPTPPPPPPPNGRKKRKYAGRKVNPTSQRQIIKAARRSNKAAKLESLLSIEECTWETSSRGMLRRDNRFGCCASLGCNETYRPTAQDSGVELVEAMRRYYHRLNPEDRRQFITERSIFFGYEKSFLIKGQPLYEYHMESFDLLWDRLRQIAVMPSICRVR